MRSFNAHTRKRVHKHSLMYARMYFAVFCFLTAVFEEKELVLNPSGKC